MKIKANAKINLSLALRGKRTDGYHLIDTVMHSVSLYDEIYIEKASKITVKDSNCLNGEENLAYKAAELFFKDFNIIGGADINIIKNIPMSAGLGGGSADAAAVLVGLQKLYSPYIKNTELERTALKLGADVPFFIEGGCKRAEGIGEIFTDLKPLQKRYFLLCKAEEKTSTGEMYRILDSKPYKECDTKAVIEAVENNDLIGLSEKIYNAFSEIWTESFVKKALSASSPLAVSLSGSGPTWFAIFDDEKRAQKAKQDLENQNLKCFLIKPCDKSLIFE